MSGVDFYNDWRNGYQFVRYSSIGLMNIFFRMWSAYSIYSDVPRVFISILQQDLFKVWRTHPGFLSKIFYRFLSILKQTGVSGLRPVKVHKLCKTVISLLTCKTDSVILADFVYEIAGAGYAGTCVMFTGSQSGANEWSIAFETIVPGIERPKGQWRLNR